MPQPSGGNVKPMETSTTSASRAVVASSSKKLPSTAESNPPWLSAEESDYHEIDELEDTAPGPPHRPSHFSDLMDTFAGRQSKIDDVLGHAVGDDQGAGSFEDFNEDDYNVWSSPIEYADHKYLDEIRRALGRVEHPDEDEIKTCTGKTMTLEEMWKYTGNELRSLFPISVKTSVQTDPMAVAILHFKKMIDEQTEEAHKREPLMIDEEDVSIILEEFHEQQQVKRWMWFDSLFGVFVAANGLLEALSREGIIDGDSKGAYITSSAFCGIFICELSIRWYFCGSFCVLMQSPWNRFDIVIITLSVIDLWILELIDVGTGGATLAVVRVIRLVRFIRLLRLLREVKTLWFLVQSWIKATPYLFWSCVFLVIICYTFGLLAFELIGQSKDFENSSIIQSSWGDLRKCMVSLAAIATFDSGGVLMREVLEGCHLSLDYASGASSSHPDTSCATKRQFIFLFIPVVAIVSLGLFNLMIGTVLSCCFELLNMDKVVNTATEKLVRHKALCELEDLINVRCRNQIGSSPEEAVVSRDLIFAWMANDPQPLKDESGRIRKIEDINVLLQNANVTLEDINSIFNEVRGIQGVSELIRVHDFIQGCLFIQSEIHDLQLTQFMSAQFSMHGRLCMLEEHLDAVGRVMNNAIAEIIPGLRKYSVTTGAGALSVQMAPGTADGIEEEVLEMLERDDLAEGQALLDKQQHESLRTHGFGGLAEAEIVQLNRHRKEVQEETVWTQFDFIWLIFVAANAITLGIDCSREVGFKRNFISDPLEGQDYVWLFVEVGFAVVFLIEFLLRAALYYQMKVLDNYRVFLFCLPSAVFESSPSTWLSILQKLPELLRHDWYVSFDALLLLLAVIDNIVLRFFFRDAKYITVLRVFRVLRLLRVARLFYLMHDLASIVSTMRLAAPIVLWNCVLLGGIMYVLAIFSVSTIWPLLRDSNYAFKDDWDSLGEAYYQMWKFPTLSGWGKLGKEIGEHTNWAITLWYGIWAMLTGFGILNLGTGIIIQQAFKYAAELKHQEKVRAGAGIKRAAIDHVQSLFKKLEANYTRMKHQKKERKKVLARNYFVLWKTFGTRSGQLQYEKDQKEKAAKAQETHVHIPIKEPPAVAFGIFKSVESISSRFTSYFSSDYMQDTKVGGQEKEKKKGKIFFQGKDKNKGKDKENAQGFQPMEALAAHSAQDIMESVMQGWTECSKEPRKVSTDDLSSHNLLQLLENKAFIKMITREGLRPDLLLMLFQRLDVLRAGNIDIDYFIEGLQRLMFPVSGIDIASTKSIVRRLYLGAVNMTNEAAAMHEVFLNVCCKLRGITPLGDPSSEGPPLQVGEGEQAVGAEPIARDMTGDIGDRYMEEIEVLAKQWVEDNKNARMKKKIEKVKSHIEWRRKYLVERGDTLVGVKFKLDDGARDEDQIEITAADEENQADFPKGEVRPLPD